MAAVLEKKDAAKFDSQVDEQLAQATSRIRAHDLAFGGLLIVASILVYATAMILLDKYLVLPEWVRQLSLAGFVGVLAGITYFTLLRPLRKRINPLYAAKQVERTIDDPKNSVTGYVDAQENGNLNPTVRAALASRAAKAAADADVNRAVDHRSLIYAGGVVVLFILTLIVLFFIFRPAQFSSLVSRTFVPFTARPIETRTQLTLVKPDPAEPTITTGQSITVVVHVGGKVPSADSPERVRLLIRHNPADPNYDEVPMVQGETSRDWEVRVPDYLVQNGFWYKVAAGDAVTPEYKVTVRSLPMFTEFQTSYEYPKYLRRKNEIANDPVIRAYRGTKVTLQAKANRDVGSGFLTLEPVGTRIPGTVVPGKPDTLQFVLKLTESSRYKLTFTATNGEHIADPFQSSITVDADQAPAVLITKPEEEETTVPANGQIVVDGKIGDDFGIDTITLKMKVVVPAERPLPDVPYLNGEVKSFHRAKDDTWPTNLDYKGSVDLAKLKKDAAKLPLELTPDMVIEYWLEATDNCTEPKPNVGKSAPKRVRLTLPKMDEADKEQLNQQKEARQNEEKQHNQQQKQKLDGEKRDQKQDGQLPKGDNPSQPKNGEKQPGDKVEPKPGDNTNGKQDTKPNGKPDAKKDNTGMGNMGNPMNQKGPNDPDNNPNDPNNKGGMNEAPMPKDREQKNIEKTAEELKKELDEAKKSPGEGKPNPTPKEQDRTDPGQNKPMPKDGMGGMPNTSEPKPEPKQPNPNDPMPMGKNDSAPADSKPQGKIEKPQDPATPKPEPKQGDPMGGDKSSAPAEKRSEPLGAPPGTDKDPPKEPQPAPKDPNQKQDPASGSTAKPATQQPQGDPGMPNAGDQKDPGANAASGPKPPLKDPVRGEEKPSAPKEPPPSGTQPQGQPNAGDAKPEKAPPAGTSKPTPKEDPMGKGVDSEPKPSAGANEPKNKDATGAAQTKPDDKNAPMGAGQQVDKGMDKPQPQDKRGNTNNAQKQPSPEEMKQLEEAVKNLDNPDPKKREEAQKTLDKAVGEEKRKEIEQLAKDLKSDDKDKQAAAQKKLEEMKQQMGGGQAGKPEEKEQPKLTEQQKKEFADAMKDLNSDDPQKKQAARDKLDKMVGENNRKELEQVMDDLKSGDKDKQAAARKKVEEWQKQAEERERKEGRKIDPKQLEDDKQKAEEIGKALEDLRNGDAAKKEAARKKLDEMLGRDTRERAEDIFKDLDSKDPEQQKRGEEKLEKWRDENQMKDLAKKAKDLNAKDDKVREKAEKDLDEQIGKENREKLQEMVKNQKPGDKQDEEKLKKELEELAKQNPPKKPDMPEDWRQGLGAGLPNKGAMEDDPKNRLKTAELNLQQFENEEYRKLLQEKKGWTKEEYEKFLDGYRRYIEGLKNEVANKDKPPVPGEGPKDTAGPLFKGPESGKVDRTTPGGAGATIGGPTAAPPGFEDAKRKFEEALKKKN